MRQNIRRIIVAEYLANYSDLPNFPDLKRRQNSPQVRITELPVTCLYTCVYDKSQNSFCFHLECRNTYCLFGVSP
jgi:hypothetical protein